MYDLITKLNERDEDRLTSRKSITRTSKTKSIRKSNTQIINTLTELKKELKEKFLKVETLIDNVILEEPSDDETLRENNMDDWKEALNRELIEGDRQLGKTSEISSKAHPMVRKRPNELVDEELSP